MQNNDDKLAAPELPQWQKDILDSRRPFVKLPGYSMPMDEFIKQLEVETEDEE